MSVSTNDRLQERTAIITGAALWPASSEASFIAGASLPVDGGLTAV
jgi:NAD(P)-dependent dehydrogenase (short-subunit alcohol dehydrogenase family)